MSTDGLTPIAVAAKRLGRSPWTLKRWYRKGILPAVIMERRWYVPESFLAMVGTSPRPGRAGILEEIAAAWFAAHTPVPPTEAVAA